MVVKPRLFSSKPITLCYHLTVGHMSWGKMSLGILSWAILSWGILSFGAKCLLAFYSNLSNFDDVLGHVLLKWIVIPYEYV